ncbi:MAG: PaaI family thioesterase [Ferrovibrio sp.]|nr:PaaI family thioesterase [Ferrovibrio sp.]
MSFLDQMPRLPLAPDDGSPHPYAAMLTPDRRDGLLAAAAVYPIFRHLGMVLEDVQTDFARIGLDHRLELTNPMGGLHGGILATMMDTAVGWAMVTTMKQGFVVATVNLAVNYYKPHLAGRASAEARIARKGRSILFAETIARNAAGEVLAQGSCTYMPAPLRQAT